MKVIQYHAQHCYFADKEEFWLFTNFYGVSPYELKRLYWKFKEYLPGWTVAYYEQGPDDTRAKGQPCTSILYKYSCISKERFRKEEIRRLFRLNALEWLFILQEENYTIE